jgi:hypothetical protein
MSAEQMGLDFGGATYERQHDQARLAAQMIRVRVLMTDAQWRTLDEIAGLTGDPPASVSARLRDLRKARFGSHTVERRSRAARSRGLYEYRLVVQ